jgi:hypothetical protein
MVDLFHRIYRPISLEEAVALICQIHALLLRHFLQPLDIHAYNMSNSISPSRIPQKMKYIKLQFDQNSIVVNYKFNSNFKRHIILGRTREICSIIPITPLVLWWLYCMWPPQICAGEAHIRGLGSTTEWCRWSYCMRGLMGRRTSAPSPVNSTAPTRAPTALMLQTSCHTLQL